jgi:hypothetical protein
MTTFRLPVGKIYKFRADIMGTQYWSAITVISGANSIGVAAGGGTLQVTVGKGAGNPLPGVETYLFSSGGTYLNRNQRTDAAGVVRYPVPAGSYKIRANYRGYQFWSAAAAVSADTSLDLPIAHQESAVTVSGAFQDSHTPLPDMPLYLFTEAGTYLGESNRTDGSGRVWFSLPQMAYKVRVDYLGRQYWSESFVWQDAAMTIPLADAAVTVTGSNQPQVGVPVYVFGTAGSYLGLSGHTDVGGSVIFRLPAGTYKFRADYQTYQYWSGEEMLARDETKVVDISTGGGNFALTVLQGAGEPLASVPCYVFSSSGAYLGISGVTNSGGEVSFLLSSGSYKFRTDYLGYQFWSDVFAVPDTAGGALTIAHRDVTLSVNGLYKTTEPLAGIATYLFTSAGSYLNRSIMTDTLGHAPYRLPDGAYKIRADYLGCQFWSDVIQGENITLTIGRGMARIRAQWTGGNISGVPVYVFSAGGAYLGMTATTDGAGEATFVLPDRTFKFRVDRAGSQYWSSVIEIMPGVENTVTVNCD